MHLILIRHAEAVERGEQGYDRDEKRPLNETGRTQCPPLASALRRMGVLPDRLLSSPLVRAWQTAEQLRAHWGEGAPPVEECDPLAPGGKKRKLIDWLCERDVETVALVGHNPDLSELAGWLIGDKGVGIDLEKAGVACIDFEGHYPSKGSGVLAWLVTHTWCRLAAAPTDPAAE